MNSQVPVASSADSERLVGARLPRVLVLLFGTLVLYAAFGKGFAYAGVPPVYVGEVVLAVVAVSVLTKAMPLPRCAPAGLAAVLGGLALAQLTVDRLAGEDPWIESLRGLAPIYYSAFAFATYALLRRYEYRAGRNMAMRLVDRAGVSAAPFIIVVAVVLAALLLTSSEQLPAWPSTGVTMLASKSGDIAVALVLVLPFVTAARPPDRLSLAVGILPALWGVAALFVTFRSRGALLALMAGALVVRPHVTRVIKGSLVITVVLLVLYVSGLSFEVRGREVSFDALGDATASLLGTRPEGEIEGSYVGTANWRAEWWDAIADDAFEQRMVLHGHGWGDNLAIRYRVVDAAALDDATVLRLPHNIFFSLAGRAGLVTAVGFLLVPLLTVLRTFSVSSGRPPPSRMVQGARGALVAAVVTGLFDVYLESPQGGILLWSLIGFLWWATAPAVERTSADGDRPVGAAR